MIAVAIDPKSLPALAQEQRCVVLEAVSNPELHEVPVAFPDASEDLGEDAVAAVL